MALEAGDFLAIGAGIFASACAVCNQLAVILLVSLRPQPPADYGITLGDLSSWLGAFSTLATLILFLICTRVAMSEEPDYWQWGVLGLFIFFFNILCFVGNWLLILSKLQPTKDPPSYCDPWDYNYNNEPDCYHWSSQGIADDKNARSRVALLKNTVPILLAVGVIAFLVGIYNAMCLYFPQLDAGAAVQAITAWSRAQQDDRVAGRIVAPETMALLSLRPSGEDGGLIAQYALNPSREIHVPRPWGNRSLARWIAAIREQLPAETEFAALNLGAPLAAPPP
jgi:hypothetical protein